MIKAFSEAISNFLNPQSETSFGDCFPFAKVQFLIKSKFTLQKLAVTKHFSSFLEFYQVLSIVGGYYGMCYGDCFSPILIDFEQQKVFIDTANYFPPDFLFHGVEINNDTVISLLEEIRIPQVIYTLPKRIGEPDVRDQGGIYLEILKNKQKYIFEIDVDSIPNSLIPFFSEIEKIQSQVFNSQVFQKEIEDLESSLKD